MKMLGECEMVLYCHLGCNGNSSGPLKSTFGINFIQFQNPVNFLFLLALVYSVGQACMEDKI